MMLRYHAFVVQHNAYFPQALASDHVQPSLSLCNRQKEKQYARSWLYTRSSLNTKDDNKKDDDQYYL